MSTEPTAPCSPHPTATKNNILTPTFIHAPGLGPDLKRVWFPLDGSVCWRVLGREAWKWLRWGWGSSALNERRCQGRVRWRICVDTPVAGNTMLGAVLAVFSWQLLLESHIVQVSQLKKCKLWQHTCETGGWTDRVKKNVDLYSAVEGKFIRVVNCEEKKLIWMQKNFELVSNVLTWHLVEVKAKQKLRVCNKNHRRVAMLFDYYRTVYKVKTESTAYEEKKNLMSYISSIHPSTFY